MSKQWRSLRYSFGYLPRVFGLVWGASPYYAFWAILLTTLSTVAAPAQIWMSKVIIDQIISTIQNHTLNTAIDWNALFLPLIGLILILLCAEVGRLIADSMAQLLRFQVGHYVQRLVLEKAAQLDIAFYESPPFYDQLALVQQESYRVLNLTMLTSDSIGLLLSVIITLSLVTNFHSLASLAMLLLALPQLLVSSQYAKDFFALLNRQTPAQRMVNYLSQLLVDRDAVKEIRLFGLQQPFLDRFQQFWHAYFAETATIVFKHERRNILLLSFSALGTAAIWIFAIVRAVSGLITIGELTLVIQSVDRVRTDLAALFKRIGIFYENALFVNSLFSFLDLQSDAVEGALRRTPQASQAPLPTIPNPLQQGIEFRNVSFRYPGSERAVLQNISFVIKPGSSVALVGDNGAGKTTLIKLLARFYDPTAGTILLDGRDLREYDLTQLQQAIGVIFQDFVRYQAT
ncbi:MAG: ABC transporter ATP-binding protein, partial [Caldilineaceae bacterium]